MKAREIAAALIALGGMVTAAASGCGSTGADDCFERVDCEVINDDGTSNGICWGKCVPETTVPFDPDPMLVWIGPARQLPECDGAVPGILMHLSPIAVAYAEVNDAPLSCPACVCSAPACELPAGVTASSLAVCQEGPGGIETPFDAPPGWDGGCVSPGMVPAESFGSYTIPPATERPCGPVEKDVPRFRDDDSRARSGMALLACKGQSREGLCKHQPLCMWGQQKPTPGWHHCVYTVGDKAAACAPPQSDGQSWSERSLFRQVIDDTRGCDECTCTPAVPSTCEASVSTYEDTTCGQPIATTTVDAEGACVDPPSAMSLESLSAEWLVNEPGSCVPSGGAPTGELSTQVVTVCCLPDTKDSAGLEEQ